MAMAHIDGVNDEELGAQGESPSGENLVEVVNSAEESASGGHQVVVLGSDEASSSGETMVPGTSMEFSPLLSSGDSSIDKKTSSDSPASSTSFSDIHPRGRTGSDPSDYNIIFDMEETETESNDPDSTQGPSSVGISTTSVRGSVQHAIQHYICDYDSNYWVAAFAFVIGVLFIVAASIGLHRYLQENI